VSKMHRFRDMTTYWLKIVEKTQTLLIWHLFRGDPLRIFRRVIPSQKLESWGYQIPFMLILYNVHYSLLQWRHQDLVRGGHEN